MPTLKEIMKQRGFDEVALAKITEDRLRAYMIDVREGKINRPYNDRSHDQIDQVRIRYLRDGHYGPTIDERKILCRCLGMSIEELQFEVLDRETGQLKVESLPNSPSISLGTAIPD